MPSSEFSNMNHKGVDFLILARPGRDQWTAVISYPDPTAAGRQQSAILR
jgi:hypothetical protein